MILSWLRLLRAPNLPSAATNVLAGAALSGVLMGRAIAPATLLLACLASIAVYACGLVWNDLADEQFDRIARPERPLPRGEISRLAAWLLTIILLFLAAALATRLPEPSRWMLGTIAALAFLYDFALKASPFLGPVALGLCRCLNLVLGMSLIAPAEPSKEAAEILHMIALHYFLYVAMLSSFARMEDSTVEIRRARIELFAIGLIVISLGARLVALQGFEFDLVRLAASGAPLLALGLFALHRSFAWKSRQTQQARETVIWLLSGVVALDAGMASYAWGVWGLLLLLPAVFGPILRKSISAS